MSNIFSTMISVFEKGRRTRFQLSGKVCKTKLFNTFRKFCKLIEVSFKLRNSVEHSETLHICYFSLGIINQNHLFLVHC